ncbi:MAG: hypothetical protein KME26_22140 [Oscillatoria princeps RMCB-10]|nr:hypothetical protein [Oscillatoria princeps RMCB-10]
MQNCYEMPATERESATGHNKSGLVFDESHPPSSVPDTRLSPPSSGRVRARQCGSSNPTLLGNQASPLWRILSG